MIISPDAKSRCTNCGSAMLADKHPADNPKSGARLLLLRCPLCGRSRLLSERLALSSGIDSADLGGDIDDSSSDEDVIYD